MTVNLSIKSVPDELAQRLRRRAERNHRSLQGELMAIIERAAAEADAAVEAQAVPRPRHKTIEQLAAEHRALYPEPFAQLPRAVDIVRADRDAR